VTPDFPQKIITGGGIVIERIAEGLFKRGHKVLVIAGYPGKSFFQKPWREVKNNNYEILWIPLIPTLNPKLKLSMPPTLPSLKYLKSIDYSKYDIIHLNGLAHLLIDCVNLIIKNPRKILTIHAFPKYVEEEASFFIKCIYKIYFQTLCKYTINSTKFITVVSKFTAEECLKKGIPANRLKVITNGISLKNYYHLPCDELCKKFNIKENDLVFLSISRIVWYKGIEYVLNALHKVLLETKIPIKYIIVGSIEDKNYYLYLTKLIRKLNLKDNVIFTGFLSHEMKLQALTRANLFIAPSLHEGFGLVILEAMALGKPIIASNCEGFRCIIKHMKTGILVKPASSEELAKAILFLLSNPKILDIFSMNTLLEVKKYDWETIIDDYENIYRQIIC
jgi:glycosyltransferase involved in cell wall biosynthesis